MTIKQKSSQVLAAEHLEKAARDFAATTAEITKPSDAAALLLSLGAVQGTLNEVYIRLAQWHGQVVHGVHHAGQDERGDPQNPGWVRADIALREAAQYGADATAALDRAHRANDVALWFDEVRLSGDR